MPINEILRELPAVNDLLNDEQLTGLADDKASLKQAIDASLDKIRQLVISHQLTEKVEAELYKQIKQQLLLTRAKRIQPVINGTGIVLHTNLGRARLAQPVIEKITEALQYPVNLEYDLTTGERGDRYDELSQLIANLTGAEDAIVVNNNAAAVMLVLNTFFQGKELIISRGQLVEIGGSFRVPDIITSTGGILKEVGTTNKTHLRDYEAAINENTGGILKVHTSNYKLIGFTSVPDDLELSKMARKNHLPLINDLGSGLMLNLSEYGLPNEPTIAEEVKYSDVVMFSGDKLLGGPQGGIIAGKKEYLAQIRKNQLLRALRVDKMTITGLLETLKLYQDPKVALQEIPILKMLTCSTEYLQTKAQDLAQLISEKTGLTTAVTSGFSKVGGGSFPGKDLPTSLVEVQSSYSAAEMAHKLRFASTPVIGRIHDDKFYLDVRTIEEHDYRLLLDSLAELK